MDQPKQVSRNKNLSQRQRDLLAARLKNRKKKVAEGVIPRRDVATAPLTPMQQQVWLFEELNQVTGVYHLPLTWEFRGSLDVPTLERALVDLTKHQPCLRTRFHRIANRVEQVVDESITPELTFFTVNGQTPQQQKTEASAILRTQINLPFLLENGPLVTYTLVRLDEKLHILMINMHHLLGDGWSSGVLADDLRACYEAQLSGQSAKLQPLPVSYGDYAAWLAQPATAERWSNDLEFWADHLESMPPLLSLFEDDAPLDPPQFRGASVQAQMESEQASKLRQFCNRLGITPFAALMAAYQAVLMRYTQSSDFCVGTPMANRPFSELAKVAGLFTNVVALRARLEPSQSFESLAHQVYQTVLKTAQHGNLPFSQVADVLNLPQHAKATPYYSTVFTYQHKAPQLHVDGLTIQATRLDIDLAKFPLTLEVIEQTTHFDFHLEYDRDRFGRNTVDTFLKNLFILLGEYLDQPQSPLIAAPLSTASQPRLPSSIRGDVDCVIARFEEMVVRYPDQVAVSFEGKDWTYRELNHQANRLAHWLRAQGVGSNTFVCLYLERNLWLLQTVLAVLKAGAAYVPIDAQSNPERISLIMEDTDAAFLLVQDETAHDDVAHARMINVDRLDLEAEPKSNPGQYPEPNDRAYVIYTSGSTGRPKGVVVRHGELAHFLEATQEKFDYGPNRSWTLFHSYAFDYTIIEIWGALAFGGRLTIVPFWTARNPEVFYQLLVDNEVTHLCQTPAAFAELTRYEMRVNPTQKAHSITHALIGGERFETRSVEEWVHFRGDQVPILFNVYGPTETVCIASGCRLSQLAGGAPAGSTIGSPHPALTVHLLDPQLRPVPDGMIGELYIGGHTLSEGYLNRQIQTAKAFIPNPFSTEPGERLYKSGDLVRRLNSGLLHYIGRCDHQVKIRGFRMELGEIEACLENLDQVSEGIIRVRGKGASDKELVAYYVAKDSDLGSPATVRDALKSRLHPAMVPARYVRLETFPLNQSGKINTKALPEPEEDQEDVSIVRPRNSVEDVILSVWENLLELTAAIGVRQSFFEVGGQSLRAAQLATRLRIALSTEFSVRDVFNAPTIAEQAALIQSRAKTAMPPIEACPNAEMYPVTPGQRIIWTTSHLPESAKAYHLPFAFRLRGPLDRAALAQAFEVLIERHESLRTQFFLTDGQLVQQVADNVDITLAWLDLSACEAPFEEAVSRDEQVAAQMFNLEQAPLLRCTLYGLGQDDHMLGILVHHIVFDGSSLNVLLDDLFTIYRALVSNQTVALEPLPVQFRDYAHWHQTNLERGIWATHREYWLTQLDGCDTRLALIDPADRPEQKTFVAEQRFGSLNKSLSQGLQKLAYGHQVTYFHVLWCLFNLLCYKLSGQKDQTFGAPFSGRFRAELERQVGFFVNMMPLRIRLHEDMPLSELLVQIRDVALAADDHQAFPLEAVFAQLNRNPTRVSPALIEAGLAWQGQAAAQPRVGSKLTLEDVDIPIRQTQYDLFILAAPNDGSTSLAVLYNQDLFDRGTIDSYLTCFNTLATDMLRLSADGRDPLIQELAPTKQRETSIANPFEELAW